MFPPLVVRSGPCGRGPLAINRCELLRSVLEDQLVDLAGEKVTSYLAQSARRTDGQRSIAAARAVAFAGADWRHQEEFLRTRRCLRGGYQNRVAGADTNGLGKYVQVFKDPLRMCYATAYSGA